MSNLPNYGEYLKDSSIDKEFIWISNGFALDEIKKVEDLPFSITNKIPKNKFIVGYVGTVGAANTLDSFLDSYSYIDNENICYVVVGGGKEKNRLAEKYCSKSVVFIDPIHKDQVQSMLRLFDICFLGWQKKSLYKYGTSANKIFDYMFSGRPIINAYSGKADLVEIANCGICVEAQDSNSIAISVLKLYNMSKNERNALGANGKNYALKNFSYEKLAAKYIHLL